MNRRLMVRAGIMAGALIAAGLVAAPGRAAPTPPPSEPPPTAKSGPVTEEEARARADSAVREHREALRSSADDEFVVWRTILDEDGGSHVRYTRTYQGLDVRGGDVVVHHTAGGRFNGATVAQDDAIAVDTQPEVSRADAATAARARFEGTVSRVGTPELVVDATGEHARLAWETEVAGTGEDGQTPMRLQVRVDASDGAVISAHDEIHTNSADGYTIYSGKVPVEVTPVMGTGGFLLQDPGNGAKTCDLHNKWDSDDTAACEVFMGFGGSIGSSDPSVRSAAGVDAHYGAALTFNYYKTKHKRNGIYFDGKGVRSRVHYGQSYVNAFWDPDCRCMTYGDGDQNKRPLVSIDVAAHEMTHGITGNSVPGDLEYKGESGGLNEATSDIFGTMVEFYAANSQDNPDYLIGEKVDIFGTGKPLRYMYQPSLDGKSQDCYNSTTASLNPHYNSGIGNHFFFLLAQGSGTTPYGFSPVCGSSPAVTGIGRDKAAAIWYRALDTYFTSTTKYFSVPNPNNTARAATLAAAADLYGYCGPEYRAVRAAWIGVNVGGYDQPCQANPAYGWVLHTNPLSGGYQPAVQRNSTGGLNRITRSDVGRYQVHFTGLSGGLAAGNGGTVHVTPYTVAGYTGQVNCKVVDWYSSGADVVAPIDCYDNAGNRANSGFTASFTRAKPGGGFAYAWAGAPTTASYEVSAIWSYNGAQFAAPTRVNRAGTGNYQVIFSKAGVSGGTAMVTAQGIDNTMCAVNTWGSAGTDESVWVWCTDPQGNLKDSAFEVTFVNEMSIVGTGQPSAYAWVTPVTGPTSTLYSFNSTAGANTSTHTPGSGEYVVRLPGMLGGATGIPHVIAQSAITSAVRCRIASYAVVPAIGTDVRVRCANPAGAATDSFFDVMYVE